MIRWLVLFLLLSGTAAAQPVIWTGSQFDRNQILGHSAPSGSAPGFSVGGSTSDSNIDFDITAKGTGSVVLGPNISVTGLATLSGGGTFGGNWGGTLNLTNALQMQGQTVLSTFGGTYGSSLVIGIGAGAALPSNDDESTAVGFYALHTASTAILEDTAVGWYSQRLVTTGQHNTSLGVNSMGAETTGQYNIALGTDAMRNTVGVSYSIAIGPNAMNDAIENDSIAIGDQVLAGSGSSSGEANVAIGKLAMSNTSMTTAGYNVAVGMIAMQNATTANANVCVGYAACQSATTDKQDVAIGFNAGASMQGGYNNTLIGYYAGSGVTSGQQNFILGAMDTTAAQNQITSGGQNIVIGYDTQPPVGPTANGQIVIGNLIYGINATGTGSTISGEAGIGVLPDTSYTLTVGGDTKINGTLKTSGYTVSTLPAASVGARAYVTDATACTFLSAPTGGGSTFCPVVYNGSAWVGG